MKRTSVLILMLAFGISLFSQEKMYIFRSDKMTLGAPVAETDSIFFSPDGSAAYFRIYDNLYEYPVADIDSINFGQNSNTVYITYNGSDVTVVNPLAFEGVSVLVEGSDVTVNSSGAMQEVIYSLSGVTTDGTLNLYSDADCQLVLNGLQVTNNDGPALNIQCEETISVELMEGTVNILTDGLTYASPPVGEDRKAAFFSEGRLILNGSGMLTVNGIGTGKHGLSADNFIEVHGGEITVTSAAKDGIHADDGLLITGGIIDVTATGDGIDGDVGSIEITSGSVTTTNNSDDVKGLSCDGEMTISGGEIDITVTGDQSKGIKCDSPIYLNGGTFTIHNSGDAILEASGSGFDPSYCTAIKSDSDVNINGADITIVASGKAGKGISSDADIVMSAGSVHVTSTGNGATYTNPDGILDAYVSTCYSSDGDIIITGGSVRTSSSGSGGKGFSSDGELHIGSLTSSPEIDITTTGTRIYISGSGQNAQYAEAKAVKSDSAVVIYNGMISIASADDGIKSEASIDILGGEIDITNSVEGLEAPYITISGGNTHVKSSDDCINTTFGNGGEQDDGSLMLIDGGYVVVSTTGGDGLDANGDIIFNGGTIIVHGPPNSPEVGMDYNGSCEMNAGFLVISGTNSFMTQAPGNGSDQYCLKIMSNQMMSSSTLFHIQDATGTDILTFQPARNYYSIVFSSDDLQMGVTYSIYTGGTSTGTVLDGLYTGGVYSGGTLKKTFSLTGTITNVNF